MPKRGFNHFPRKEYAIVNLDRLMMLGLSEITPRLLVEQGLVRNLKARVKVLGDGELKKALKIQAHRFSKQAKKKIEAAGGQVTVIQ